MISFRVGIEIRGKSSLGVGVVLVLLLSTVAVSIGQADHAETGAEKSPQDIDDLLSEELKETLDSKEEDDLVEVVIRFEPYDNRNDNLDTPLNDIDTEKVVSDLKEHSESKQSDVINFLDNSEGRVLNTFWIANAVLAEAPVGMLNDLAEHTEIWSIHDNFEVETYNHNDFLDNEDILEDGFGDTLDMHDEKWIEVRVNKNRRYFLETGTFEKRRTDSEDEVTWGLEKIGVEEVWAQGYDGLDVHVAVSDTGVDIDHPDLKGKMVNAGEDEYYTGGWIEFDSEGNIVGNSTPHDTSGHGSHVSGTVVGGNASGTSIGIAPEAELMHALVLPGGQGTFAQTLAGMEWKVEPHDRFGDVLEPIEEYRADVASMSWGSYGYDEEKEEPIKNLVDAGIVPVAAVGNLGEGTFGSPAAIYEAFAVGASNESDGIAEFSSGDIVEDGRGDTPEEYVKPDFSAPGVDIKSAVPDSEWKYASGTSMAAPHLAGTVALMLDANSNLSIGNVYDSLKITADHYEARDSLSGEEKNTRYGHGIINARKALDSVTGNVTISGVENINRYQATFIGEVLKVPNNEIEVFFRYKEKGTDEWYETDSIILEEPQEFEIEEDGLNKATSYEYKAVGVVEDEEETSFSLEFTTHDDVEISTLSQTNLTFESALLRGEVTEIYIEDVSVFFRYRERGTEGWNKTSPEEITDPKEFEYKLEELKDVLILEYKAIAESEDDEFVGDLVRFPGGPVEPEWDEENGAYMITNIGELQWIKNDLEADYVLQNDIDASWTKNWPGENGFVPIGNESSRFNGSLYGRGYKIKRLFTEGHRGGSIGLFGYIGEKGLISEISVVDYYIPRTNGAITGGLAAINHGIIEKSFSEGNIDRGRKSIIGGLVGYNRGTIDLSNSSVYFFTERSLGSGGLVGWNAGKIIDSHATGRLSGSTYLYLLLGGVVGLNLGSITRSYSTADLRVLRGDVSAHVGGVTAENYGEVDKSYSTGKIEPVMVMTAGGLIGSNHGEVDKSYTTTDLSSGALCGGGLIGENSGNVTDSYAIGEANGGVAGGLIGENSGNVTDSYAIGPVGGGSAKGLIAKNQGNVTDSYWDIEKSGINTSDGGSGLNTSQMIGDNAPDHMQGFDFNETWETVEREHDDVEFDGYPILQTLCRENQTDNQENKLGVSVSTLPVEEKDSYSALLRGELVDMGFSEEVDVYFYWRERGEEGWNEVFVKTMNSSGVFEHRLEDLTLGSHYEYYAYAEGELSAEGSVRTFKITEPPNIETHGAEEITYDSARLRGELLELGTAYSVSVSFQYRERHEEEWKETSSQTLTEPGKFHIHAQGLQPDTQYEFRARAAGDEEDHGVTMNFTTEELPTYEMDIVSSEGGEVVEPGEGTFEYEKYSGVQLEAVPDEHYHFVEWTGDIESLDNPGSNSTTMEILDNYSITAKFEIDTYTLEVSSTKGGEVVEPGEGTFEYEAGTTVDLKATSEEGYHFVEWSCETDIIDDPTANTTIEMLSDYTITAEFAVNEYELNVSIKGEGAAEPGRGEHRYEYGEEITLKAFPEEGWLFSHWSGDITEEDDEITVTIENDMNITAHFVEEPFFEVEILAPEDGEEFDDEEILIEYTAKNTRGINEERQIVLEITDEEGNLIYEDDEEITLGPDETHEGEFTWEAEHTGEFEVTVMSVDEEGITDSSDQISIYVSEEEPETALWWLIGSVVIAVVLIFILMKVKKSGDRNKREDIPRLRKKGEE